MNSSSCLSLTNSSWSAEQLSWIHQTSSVSQSRDAQQKLLKFKGHAKHEDCEFALIETKTSIKIEWLSMHVLRAWKNMQYYIFIHTILLYSVFFRPFIKNK